MSVRLTIGLPAFNEEASLAGVIDELLAALPGWIDDFELLCVNDGSTDRTATILDGLAAREPRMRVVHHPNNRGLAGFSTSLLDRARGEFLVAVSADGQVTPDMVRALWTRALDGCDVVIGCRRSKPDYTAYRRLVSWTYNRAVQLAFGRDFGDIGFVKLYRTALLRNLRCISTGAFLNAERLIRLDRAGARIARVPVDAPPRRAGRAKGARARWVYGATRDLARVTWDIYGRGSTPRRP
ncbi:glycosyltransferase family 2 protein [Haliangium sp.]|uniref:glycosyltransferase family 2 protein n=1 Tax=Haliangium sp. TaxID=2663208 RepID=UPI003D12332A